MDRTAATHSSHDELLIVRLFGGDVSGRERTRALELMGDCGDCRDLFDELGATASAAEALPVPVRPRDFALTEADAARLRNSRGRFAWLAGVRTVRSLGRSLVAIGLFGVIATGSLSMLSTSTATSPTSQRFGNSSAPGELAVSSEHSGGQDFGPSSMAPTGSIRPASIDSSNSAAVSSTPGTATNVKDVTPAPNPTGPTTGPVAAVTPNMPPAVATSNSYVNGGGTADGGAIQDAAAAPDARIVWVGGFGSLFLLGLMLLIGPLILRRRAR